MANENRMISKDEFLRRLKQPESASNEIEDHWDAAAEAASVVRAAMPGIGFISIEKRLNAFVAVCRHLDQMIDRGVIDIGDAQLTLNILRLSDKAFEKAIVMFDLRGTRLGVVARSELPSTAREYLAGLEYFG